MRRIKVQIANNTHLQYAREISEMLTSSAGVRGTGIAMRSPAYIASKMSANDAVIALYKNQLAGFCYIEVWDNKQYVAHSGLIVHPDFRNQGLGKRIKDFVFKLSLKKYPNSKVFGITTELAVMKINSDLGYQPVTFSELPNDPQFWNGCNTCTNHDILLAKKHKMCLCTGMLYTPEKKSIEKKEWLSIKMPF